MIIQITHSLTNKPCVGEKISITPTLDLILDTIGITKEFGTIGTTTCTGILQYNEILANVGNEE